MCHALRNPYAGFSRHVHPRHVPSPAGPASRSLLFGLLLWAALHLRNLGTPLLAGQALRGPNR